MSNIDDIKDVEKTETPTSKEEVKKGATVKPKPIKDIPQPSKPIKTFNGAVVVDLVSKVGYPVEVPYGDDVIIISPYARVNNVEESKLINIPKSIIKI